MYHRLNIWRIRDILGSGRKIDGPAVRVLDLVHCPFLQAGQREAYVIASEVAVAVAVAAVADAFGTCVEGYSEPGVAFAVVEVGSWAGKME